MVVRDGAVMDVDGAGALGSEGARGGNGEGGLGLGADE